MRVVEEISSRARAGDKKAIRSLVQELNQSDGAISEWLCWSLVGILSDRTVDTLDVLSRMPKKDRKDPINRCVGSESSPDNTPEFEEELAKNKAKYPTVVAEIQEAIKNDPDDLQLQR